MKHDGTAHGLLVPYMTVWCGGGAPDNRCMMFLETGCRTRRPAMRQARDEGWGSVQGSGWLCPECYQEYLRGKARKETP